MLFLEAIARQEGFYEAGSRSQRNNNPGDLEYHGWEELYNGTKGSDPRFTVFASSLDGFRALRHLFTFPMYFGKTLEDAFNIYAPPNENQTNMYLTHVCMWTGLSRSSIITLDLLKLPEGI